MQLTSKLQQTICHPCSFSKMIDLNINHQNIHLTINCCLYKVKAPTCYMWFKSSILVIAVGLEEGDFVELVGLLVCAFVALVAGFEVH